MSIKPALMLPLLAFAAPAAAAEIQIQVQGPVVEITAMEQVPGKPDIATITAGVTTRATTAVEAMQRNAGAMDRVIAAIKARGIAAKDIQTAGITLNPQWRYNNDQTPPTFLGYDAGNRVTVINRDVSKTGPILDALVASGANEISGPAFSIEDDTAQRREARRMALAAAQAQAREYATAAGFANVRLLEINDTVMPGQVRTYDIMVTGRSAMAAKTPVEPGMVGTSVQITVKYEMVR